MRHSRPLGILALALCCEGCVQGPSFGRNPGPPRVEVTPARPRGSARVVRIDVTAVDGFSLDPAELWLFAGELSDYHLGRINRRDVPATLSERKLPVRVEISPESSRVTLAPNAVLEPGGRYTLAAPGWGRLLQFDVDPEDETPLLERLWPPAGSPVSGLIVLCGARAPGEPFDVFLEPAGLRAALEPNFGVLADGRRCVSVRLPSGAEGLGAFAFAPEASGVLFDPVPFETGSGSTPLPADCAEDELALGPGCARVEDDRLTVRNTEEPLLWALESEGGARVERVQGGARWLVRGLQPDQEQRLRGRAVSVGGVDVPFDLNVRTLPERPHLVLNEVLANPVGSEPAAEWVELFNDGQRSAELSGLRLRDSAAAIELPSATIAPGEYVVIARSDFPVSGGADVPLAAGTLLVQVPVLAKSGLSNAGEALQLESAEGFLLSRFPGLASKRAGVSLARVRVDAFDDDAAAFVEHGAPGASPGAPNY